MLVASQGKSPTMALGNYMRQREQVKRGIPFDDPSRLKSGTADSALYQLAQGNPLQEEQARRFLILWMQHSRIKPGLIIIMMQEQVPHS